MIHDNVTYGIVIFLVVFVPFMLKILDNVHKRRMRETHVDHDYSINDCHKEISRFAILLFAKESLNRLLMSKQDMSGSLSASRDIFNEDEIFFRGMVANIIGSMSPNLKAKFGMYYNMSTGNTQLIHFVHNMITSYNRQLLVRLQIHEDDADKLVKKSCMEDGVGKTDIDIVSYAWTFLITDMNNDVVDLISGEVELQDIMTRIQHYNITMTIKDVI